MIINHSPGAWAKWREKRDMDPAEITRAAALWNLGYDTLRIARAIYPKWHHFGEAVVHNHMRFIREDARLMR